MHTPNKVENWIFSAEKIIIDGKVWKTKKANFSNDLLELKQVKIEINDLEVVSREEQLRFKSSLNYLVLDEKVSIPFWFGERTLTQYGEGFKFKNRWNIGYDNLDKDGYYVGRKFNSINLGKNFALNLEPQFLIQRSLNGYTNSFVNEGDSITGEKVRRDIVFMDNFALRSEIEGKINTWNLEIEKQINSLDFNKFTDAFRLKSSLSKEINFLD